MENELLNKKLILIIYKENIDFIGTVVRGHKNITLSNYRAFPLSTFVQSSGPKNPFDLRTSGIPSPPLQQEILEKAYTI